MPSLPAGRRWIAIGAGERHSTGVANGGVANQVYAWGDDTYLQTEAPISVYKGQSITLPNSHDVDAGEYDSIALNKNGTVAVWGGPPASLGAVPAGLSHVIAIAIGREHALVLESNGTVVTWGENDYSQLDVPSGLLGVKAIAAGGYHSLALKSNGQIVAWGRDDFGQTDVPALPPGSRYSAIAAGALHSLAIVPPKSARRSDGRGGLGLGWLRRRLVGGSRERRGRPNFGLHRHIGAGRQDLRDHRRVELHSRRAHRRDVVHVHGQGQERGRVRSYLGEIERRDAYRWNHAGTEREADAGRHGRTARPHARPYQQPLDRPSHREPDRLARGRGRGLEIERRRRVAVGSNGGDRRAGHLPGGPGRIPDRQHEAGAGVRRGTAGD